MMKKKLILFIILALLMSCILIIFFVKLSPIRSEKEEDPSEVLTTLANEAESMIVMDMNTKRVLNKYNEKKQMLPASITKILTCITCIENYDLDHLVVIGDEIKTVEGSSIYLKVGDVISIRDLLYGLMLCSGNDAATALAYQLNQNVDDFVYLMNQIAKRIGMKDSSFTNPSGLDRTTKNITTAYDMALLMSYAMKNETFRQIVGTKHYQAHLYSEKTMYFHNKHKLLQNNDSVIGGKTGYTKQAHRTLVTCFKKENFEIVVVTFNCGSDWSFHEKLAQKAFGEYVQKRLISKLDLFFSTLTIGKIYVDKKDLLVPVKQDENISVKLLYNDQYVQLTYYEKDEIIASVLLRRKNE